MTTGADTVEVVVVVVVVEGDVTAGVVAVVVVAVVVDGNVEVVEVVVSPVQPASRMEIQTKMVIKKYVTQGTSFALFIV